LKRQTIIYVAFPKVVCPSLENVVATCFKTHWFQLDDESDGVFGGVRLEALNLFVLAQDGQDLQKMENIQFEHIKVN
jgi:hypothetical protein